MLMKDDKKGGSVVTAILNADKKNGMHDELKKEASDRVYSEDNIIGDDEDSVAIETAGEELMEAFKSGSSSDVVTAMKSLMQLLKDQEEDEEI